MTKVIVAGIGGRMGQRLGLQILADNELSLVGACEARGTSYVGKDAGAILGKPSIGVAVSENLAAVVQEADVVIDFTRPEASLKHLEIAREAGCAMVIGTTGFDSNQMTRIRELAQDTRLVLAPNMSVGVNVMFKIAQDLVNLLGEGYDVEIIEAHHRMKKDAPSGTALRLAQLVAEARGLDLESSATYARRGRIGERKDDEIGLQTIRAGDIVGEHTLLLAGIGERIEFTHRAHSRDNFARGAIRAAKWIVDKNPGFYDMWDVLGLR